MNFPSKVFFYNINHGLRAATLKKNSLWLLLLYIAVATYSYNEKVCRTMCNATVSCLLEKLSHIPKSLIATYKFFIRPHLDYCDVTYDQPIFFSKIERIQNDAALAITVAIRGTPQTKLQNELGLELLKFRRWFRQHGTLFKIKIQNWASTQQEPIK